MIHWRGFVIGLGIATLAAVPGHAQDPIRLGIQYSASSRPGIVVVAGAGLDSVRKIIERDLQYSDRFEIAFWPDSAGPLTGPLNAAVYKQLGLAWAVELQPTTGGMEVKLHHLATGGVQFRAVRGIVASAQGDERMAIHGVSDEITQAASAGKGIAATRILFTLDDAIWSVDSDGANLQRVSRGTGRALSASWSRDGSRMAFTELRDYAGPIVLQNLNSGARQVVAGTTGSGNSLTPAFSPDGTELIFALGGENGTDLWSADIARMCCVRRLTTGGRVAINMNPAYSPDGSKVAFVSDRAGRPQIYMMDADGANQVFLVPLAGQSESQAPDWSPDGLRIIFHRGVVGGNQIHVYELGSRRVTAVTSNGRNEDPSWAPDGQHVVYASTRGGRQQLWVMDLESGNSRQLTNVSGRARLPAWSPSLGRRTQ
jgi:TolB protein